MKKLALCLALMGLAVAAKAAPYVQGFWTKGAPLYMTQLTNVSASKFGYINTTTAWAPFYHPLSAGSLTRYLPASLQAIIPPESWACTIGAGYLAANGGAQFSLGCGLNLAASVQALASRLLLKSSNQTVDALGNFIAPNPDGSGLYFQRSEVSSGPRVFVFVPAWSTGVAFHF
ncbi:MAG: hypothetical protein KGJ13_02280 [Patescibacteria group bacterium]|nr:hypothetical protein [Patescibacteria group bacterium]